MTYSQPVRKAARRTRWTVLAALVVAGAAVVGVLDYHSSAASTPSVTSTATASTVPSRTPPMLVEPLVRSTQEQPRSDTTGPVGVADGVVPDGLTVFDSSVPAVAKLDPALLGALRRAASAAAGSGITFYVNSGWRSPKYQQQLLQQAISKYGSEEAAERWVATPDTSAHVSGNAVDIGRPDAAKWLSRQGAAYGLCQIYRNESWHFELRPEAIASGCPAMYADPTQDPRMQH
jgi:LAS superfamily LD-carboxypeptidase LdcB